MLHIRFNNPAKHNALSVDMWEAVPPLLAKAEHDDDVRMVVFSGEGGKSFVSGADISQFEDMRAARGGGEALRADGRGRARRASTSSPSPRSRCIRGYCIGGGVNVAISCDIRVASDDSVFFDPGHAPGAGLPLLGDEEPGAPGRARASPRTSSSPARRLDAAEALRIGLVNRVATRDGPRCAAGGVHRRDHHRRAAHHQGRQAHHPRGAQAPTPTFDMELVPPPDPRLLRERGLRRGPQGLHGKTQADVQGEMTMRTLLAGLLLSSPPPAARPWPEKPIKVLIGYAPGGSTDVVARLLAPEAVREARPADRDREQARRRGRPRRGADAAGAGRRLHADDVHGGAARDQPRACSSRNSTRSTTSRRSRWCARTR